MWFGFKSHYLSIYTEFAAKPMHVIAVCRAMSLAVVGRCNLDEPILCQYQ